ncbi:MAG: PAS domain S-box protein [Victivallales bacterium]
MSYTHTHTRGFSRSVKVFSGLTGLMALIVLASWFIGKSEFIALSQDFKPMGVTTAFLLFFLSSGIFLHQKWPSNHAVNCFSFIVIIFTVCVGLIVGLQFFFEFGSPLEKLLLSAVTGAKDSPRGHMSPVTSILFIIISLAFLFELPPLVHRLCYRQAASILALAVLFLDLVIIFSYLAGEPILCSDKTVPMALPTAILFLTLNIGLVIASGHDTWPLSIFNVESGAPLTQLHWFMKGPLIVFLFIITVIGVSGFFFLKNQISVFRLKAQDELLAIADLKAKQISVWYNEMVDSANYFFMDPVLSDAIRIYMDNPSDIEQKHKILAVLESAQKNFHFNRALFIGRDQKMQLCFPLGEEWMGQLARSFVNETLQTGKVTVSDLHISLVKHGYVNMDIFVPILPKAIGFNTSRNPLGVLMFEINPSHFLFPTLQDHPSYSHTGEILLVRPEGNDVVFLNELRYRKNTALKLRFPVETKKQLPAVMAVTGKEGIVEGTDYRNVPVVAALRKIHGTPWFIVFKVDRDEIKAPIRNQAMIITSVVSGLLLVVTLGLAILWHRRDTQWLREKLALDSEKRLLAERILHLHKQSNDIILLMNGDWRIIEANDRAVQEYGCSLDELKQLSLLDLRVPEARSDFERQTGNISIHEGAVFETMHHRKDGSPFPVECSVSMIEIDGKKYYQNIVRDITERRKHEKEIGTLNRLYATLSQINQAIVRIGTREVLFEQVCRAIVELGKFKMAWVGWPDPKTRMVIPVARFGDEKGYLEKIRVFSDDRPEGRGPVGTCLREGRTYICNDLLNDVYFSPWREEAVISDFHAVTAIPICLRGVVRGVLAIYSAEMGCFGEKEVELLEEAASDISFGLDQIEKESERRRTEEFLKEAQQRLKLAVSGSNVGLWDWNIRTNAAYFSPEWKLQLGYKDEEIANRFEEWESRLHPDDREQAMSTINEFIVRPLPNFEMEVRLRRKDGSYRWILIRASLQFGSDGKAERMFGCHIDVTDRRRLEERLRQSEKMDAIGQLAGGIAHDFNNQLVGIMGYAEMLYEKLDDENLKNYADNILKASRHAADLTGNLLAFARKGKDVEVPVEIHKIIEEVVAILERSIDKRIEIRKIFKARRAVMIGDPSQLQNALLNLAINASDAMPSGGELVFSTEIADMDEYVQKTHVQEIFGEKYLKVCVIDNGIGMDEDMIKHVFEPFFTTKEIGKGAGTGLASVYGTVKNHKGFIDIRSEPGHGTTFTLYFPLFDGGVVK